MSKDNEIKSIISTLRKSLTGDNLKTLNRLLSKVSHDMASPITVLVVLKDSTQAQKLLSGDESEMLETAILKLKQIQSVF